MDAAMDRMQDEAERLEVEGLEAEARRIVDLIGGLGDPRVDLSHARAVLDLLGPGRWGRARELAETLSQRSDARESSGLLSIWGSRVLNASGLVGSRRRIGPPGRCPTCGAIR